MPHRAGGVTSAPRAGMTATRRLVCACSCAFLAASAQPARAQAPSSDILFSPGVFAVNVLAGGAAFSDFHRSTRSNNDQLERRMSAQTTVAFGAGASFWLSRHWGVRAAVAFVPSRLEERSPPSLGSAGTPAVLFDDSEDQLTGLDVWQYDAELLFRFPFSMGRVAPYGFVGGGAVDYRLTTKDDETVPTEVSNAFRGDRRREPALVVGIGSVIPLERFGWLLTFEISDHITATPLGIPTESTENGRELAQPDIEMTSNLRLLVGLTVPIATLR